MPLLARPLTPDEIDALVAPIHHALPLSELTLRGVPVCALAAVSPDAIIFVTAAGEIHAITGIEEPPL